MVSNPIKKKKKCWLETEQNWVSYYVTIRVCQRIALIVYDAAKTLIQIKESQNHRIV